MYTDIFVGDIVSTPMEGPFVAVSFPVYILPIPLDAEIVVPATTYWLILTVYEPTPPPLGIDTMKPPRGVLIVAPFCIVPEVIAVTVRVVPTIPPVNVQKSRGPEKLIRGVFHSGMCGIIFLLVFAFEYTIKTDILGVDKDSVPDIQDELALKLFTLATCANELLSILFVTK